MERQSAMLEAPEIGIERVLVEYEPLQDNYEQELNPEQLVMPVPAQGEQPTKAGWRRTLIHVGVGICLGSSGDIALLLHITKQVYPDLSYMLAFWMTMGNAFDTGWFVIVLILGLLSLAVMKVYSITVQELKEAKQKAAEMENDAKEILDKANQGAMDIMAGARREAGEIKKTAKDEAADIRIKTKQETAQILNDAHQEAATIISDAHNKGKVVMDDFWVLVQAKAKDLSISSEDLRALVTVFQAARAEAATVRAQAEEEAATIIAQAREAVESQATEIVHRARVQAADILLLRGQEQDSGRPAGVDGHAQQYEVLDYTQQEAMINLDDFIAACCFFWCGQKTSFRHPFFIKRIPIGPMQKSR
jgi:F0F1-type ATP synthase membrane subunit b/b'